MTKKILVIDDHPDTIRLIEMTLRRHGYDVIGAQSGAEGIELAHANPPDLVLLDVMMPDMDGVTVCRTIREETRLQHLPIIMFTAKTQVKDKKASFEAGADDYLTKPTRPAELISRVEAILARTAERTASADISDLPGPGRGPQPTTVPDDAEENCLIAVLGARGGAGATTVALNLAVALADTGHDTTLVDLDTRQGHIAIYLGHSVQQDVAALLKQPPQTLTREINRYFVRQSERLQLLLSRPHLGQDDFRPRRTQIEAMTDALLDSGRCVVVDLGSNDYHPTYPLLQLASHVLFCLRPERAAITATKQLIEQYSQALTRPEKLHALMLDFGLDAKLPRHSVEKYLGLPLLDVIKIDPQQIARAVNRDTPLVHVRPQNTQSEGFHRLARRFAPV